MAFINENVNAGLPINSNFQVGVSDVDEDLSSLEQNILFPWPSNPAGSYVYYECSIQAFLDSGIVVHNRLPQVNNTADTLSSIDFADPNLEQNVQQGVNLNSNDQYQDILQRMGHSRYWFNLKGEALRVGYQVPIPKLVTIGGVPVVPYDKNIQWAFNRIAPGANYNGVILWHAQWSLWYTTLVPPKNSNIPAQDPSAHISGTVVPPADGIQVPYSNQDDDAQPSLPPQLLQQVNRQ